MDEIQCYFKEVECNPLSHGIIMKIIHEELEMSKVCVPWVPKLPTDAYKASQMAAMIEFLTLHHQEGESLFTQIMMGDEKWVYHYIPKMKQASMMQK